MAKASTNNLLGQINKKTAMISQIANTDPRIKDKLKIVTDDMLLDDPNNKEMYGDLEVEELADIMRKTGKFDGIIEVYPYEGKYMIISGHRRREAARRAGIKELYVFVKDAPSRPEERMIRLARANQFRDKTPLVIAHECNAFYENHQKVLKELQGRLNKINKEFDQHINDASEDDAESIKIEKEESVSQLMEEYKSFGYELDEEGNLPKLEQLVSKETSISVSSVHRYRQLLKLEPSLQKFADVMDGIAWSGLIKASQLTSVQQQGLAQKISSTIKLYGQDHITRPWLEKEIEEFKMVKYNSGRSMDFDYSNQSTNKHEEPSEQKSSDANKTKKVTTRKVIKAAENFKLLINAEQISVDKNQSDYVKAILEDIKAGIDKLIKEIN